MNIVNIVVSGSLNQPVDLCTLLNIGDKYQYNPHMYHGGYIHLTGAKATIYQSGKFIIAGIKSVDAIENVWKELTDILTPYLIISLFQHPAIRNMVALEQIPAPVNLNQIIKSLTDEQIEYEPEVFPGLMWKSEYGSVNLFSSGRMLLLGCTSEDDLVNLKTYVCKKLQSLTK